jgi:hypothetical protein
MIVFHHCLSSLYDIVNISTRFPSHFVTSATPSLPFWNALLHSELTLSSNLSLAAVQSAVCSVRTFFSSSAFQRSFAVSSRPMRTSRLMGVGNVGSGSTMPFSRTACWCSRALWWSLLRACMLSERYTIVVVRVKPPSCEGVGLALDGCGSRPYTCTYEARCEAHGELTRRQGL